MSSNLFAFLGEILALTFNMGDTARGLIPFAENHYILFAFRVDRLMTTAAKFNFRHSVESIPWGDSLPILFE